MELRFLEGGRYRQGSDGRERALEQAFPLSVNAQFFGNAEYPAHHTWITKPFWIANREVTVKQWRTFTEATGYVTTAEKNGTGIIGWSPTPEENPLYQSHDFERKAEFTWKNPGFEQSDNHPVVGVSFEDVTAFLTWLSEKEGSTYRLPTEAEWEFACRAGSETWFSFGDNPRETIHRHANIGNVELEKHRKHSVERQWLLDWGKAPADGHIFTAPTGSFEPNAFGLFDMHGNVWEWCSDLWLDTFYKRYDWPKRGEPREIAVDPVNHSEAQTRANEFRTIRGGCWYNGPIICRSSNRTYWDAPDAACYLGFRVVKEADPKLSTKAIEAYTTEIEARKAIESFGGSFSSSRGLSLEVQFDNSRPFDPAVLPYLHQIPLLEKLTLAGKQEIELSTEHLRNIALVGGLQELNFRTAFNIENADLSVLAELPHLEKLHFSRSIALGDTDLAKLKDLTELRVFTGFGTSGNISDAGVSQLKGNRNLEVLNLYETEITGSCLAHFTDCPLHSIELTKSFNGDATLTDANLKHLSNFPELVTLNLTGQENLTDATLEVIGSLVKLDNLNLHGCKGISPDGFAPIGNLTHLSSLNLHSTSAADIAMEQISALPRLESLRVGSPELTDSGIRSISKIFSLKNLYLNDSTTTDQGLKSLGRVNRLDKLDLYSVLITGTGLGPVCRLPELSDLKLQCPALTDAAFDHLSHGKSLRKIRLVERGVKPPEALTNQGILKMASANWLRELWLPRNGTGITEEAINELNQLMPKTQVIPYTVEWNEN
ncbi:MAG: SUMF1/EgtB/PvdO family nonheme iron enzyme [Verrucomicrobiales bacterium]|nr:SUMF1/EgtB/PvdO family nonheme iron enzyme [Verrucomicrobiales bacterium]